MITQGETFKTTFESIWPLCIFICMYNTFKMEMHMVTCLLPFNNLSVTFAIMLHCGTPPITSKLLVCPSVHLWFVNLISSCLWMSVPVHLFLHILKDINHSTSELWGGFLTLLFILTLQINCRLKFLFLFNGCHLFSGMIQLAKIIRYLF